MKTPALKTSNLLLRSLLFIFAACAVGLVSFVCVQLHDSFVKFAMVSSSICLAVELNSLPLVSYPRKSKSLTCIITCADICIFALSLVAAIIMSREIRVAQVGREIYALSSARTRAVYAASAFLWAVFAVSLITLFMNLHELGHNGSHSPGCEEDDNSSISEKIIAQDSKPILKKQQLVVYRELFNYPDALAHAVAVPYV